MSAFDRKGIAYVIIEAVHAAGRTGIPDGYVYAALLSSVPEYSLTLHQEIIGVLVRSGVLCVDNHVLTFNESVL